MPPEHANDAETGGGDQHKKQSGIFDPSNRRNTERHDETEQADLPRQNLYARGKSAERQKSENGQACCLGAEYPLHTRQQQHVHYQKKRKPVQRLRRYQSKLRGAVSRAVPSRADTNQRDERRQDFPIAGNRLFRETRIGDADRGEDQHQAEGEFPHPEVQMQQFMRNAGLRHARRRGRAWIYGAHPVSPYPSRRTLVTMLPVLPIRAIASVIGSIATAMWKALAWTRVARSRAMATWPFQNRRSPRLRSRSPETATGLPSASSCISLSRGHATPQAVSAICTRPEQSSPSAVLPPHRYGVPKKRSATATKYGSYSLT